MAFYDSLNFEYGDMAAFLANTPTWGIYNSPKLSSNRRFRGWKALYIDDTAGYREYKLERAGTLQMQFYCRFMLNLETLPASLSSVIGGIAFASGQGMTMKVTSTGIFQLSSNNTLRASSTTQLSLDRWTEVYMRGYAAAASSVCEIVINGETLRDTASLTDSVTYWMGFGLTEWLPPCKYYIDAVEYNTTEYPASLLTAPPTDQQYSYPTVTTISSAWTANSGIVTYSDNFNRADGNLVSPWTGVIGGQLVIASGVVWNHTHPANGLDIMYYNASDVGVNQFSECTTMLSGGSYRDGGPAVRVTPASGFYDCGIGGGTAIIRRRFDDTILVTVNTPEPASSDIIRLEATGTNPTYLSLYKNNILIASATDSSAPVTSGKPGLQVYSGSTVLDNWRGGTVPDATLIGESIPTVSGYVDYMDFEEATIDLLCSGHGFTKGLSQDNPTTSKKYRGNQSLKLSYLGNINKSYTNPYPPKTFFRLMLNIESYPSYWDRQILGGVTNQGWEWSAILQTDGRMRFESPNSSMGATVLYTANPLALDKWHEMFMRITTEEDICECIIDGERLTNNDAQVPSFAQGIMNMQIGSGDGANNNAGVVYIDEFEQNTVGYPGYGSIQSSSPPDDDIYEAKLGTMIDPGVHTDHFLEYTYRKPADVDRIDLYAGLYTASGVIYQTLTSGIATGYVDGILAIPNDRAAQINDYSDLRVRFIAHNAMASGLVWRYGFEASGEPYTYTVPSPTAISGVITNTDSFVGDRCWKAFSPVNQNNIDAQICTPAALNITKAFVTGWIKIADNLSYARYLGANDYGGYDCSASVGTARTVRLVAGYSIRATSTTLVPTNSWVRLDVKCDHSNATVACVDEVRFNGELLQWSGTLGSASNVNYCTFSAETGNTGNSVTYFDNLYVYSNDYY